MNEFTIQLLEWIGTATGIIGASILSLNLGVTVYGFVFMFFCSLFWILAGRARGNSRLVIVQSAFLVLAMLGIVRWL